MASFNPVVYNEGGIFRHSDFVGYIPDFLKDEPDVVTLMQLMSDYINNAYRNIQTTSEFELKRLCTETSRARVKREMQKLQEMFELAYSRGESVILVSSPRNNIKNNFVIGNIGAEYPIEINYAVASVADEIPGATSLGIGKKCADGQVVYVTYTNTTPIQTIPYYYDADSNKLLKEPMGDSQDPFTGTLNKPSRMVQFNVDMVGNVGTRFAKTVKSVDYYEVFFKLHIYGLTSIENMATAEYEVDGINTEADDVVIDYCNRSTTSSEKYRATIKFAEEGAFSWKAGFPTGIFYFRESSGSKLTNLGSDTSILSPDPTLEHTVERYKITGVEVTSGIVKAYLDNYPGQYSYAMCYIVQSDSGLILGRYKMDATMAAVERFDTGKKYVLLSSYDGSDTQTLLINTGKLELVIIPLFYSKQVIDYDNSYKMVKWDNQYPMCGTRTIDTNNLMMTAASITSNEIFAADFVPSKNNCAGNEFYLPSSMSVTAGTRLYSTNGMWNGIAVLDTNGEPTKVSDGQWSYKLAGSTTISHSSFGKSGSIYKVTSGMLQVSADSNLTGTGYWDDTDLYQVGDLVLLTSATDSDDTMLGKITEVSADDYTMTFECSTLGCNKWYFISKVSSDESVVIDKLAYRNVYSDYTAGAVKWSNGGDVFTQKYMLAYSYDSKTYSLFRMITDVTVASAGSYSAGDFVSYDGVVYQATKDVILPANTSPAGTAGFIVDRFTHYSVGFKVVNNAFMPYYGQYTALDYGETPDYSVDMSTTLLPLYICKVKDTSLKYGWKDREYMYYRNELDLSTRPRNGFVELYSTGDDNDIVNNDLANFATGYMDYPFVKRGTARFLDVDIDNSLSAVNNYDGTWTVTVQSSDHGLVDGAEISISGVTCTGEVEGLTYADLVFNRAHVTVNVIDADNFSYTTTPLDEGGNAVDIDSGTLIGGHQNAICTYCRDYRYAIAELQVSDDGKYVRINATNIGYHNDTGTTLVITDGLMICDSNEDVDDVDISGEYVAIADPDPDADDRDTYVCLENTWGLAAGGHYIPDSEYARIGVPVTDGDLVFDGTNIYKVGSGIWELLDRTALSTPFTIFSRHNFFDISDTNPALGKGKEYAISQLHYNGKGRALVVMRNSIDYITAENADLIENHTEVYIKNVYPTSYCGWHMITKVYSPGIFEIAIKDTDSTVDGTPVENRTMLLQPGTWYRYTVTAHDWDKISNCATYSTANIITNIRRGDTSIGENSSYTYVYTNMEHNLSVGDYVLFDTTGTACYSINSSTYSTYKNKFRKGRVVKVVNERLFLTDYDADVLNAITAGVSTVFRGYLLNADGNTYDNLEILRDEYTKTLRSYGNSRIRFRDGDIVVTLGQINTHEIAAWRVVNDANWIPIRKKRVVKIRNISVDMYENPEFNAYDESTEAVEYKYRAYSEVDIANTRLANHLYYLVPDCFARNYVFTEAALEHLDTVKLPILEYNAKYDYGTVAPRDDFEDETFQGVPDMKYPLVEKVERLSYLKDMSVLDYDLIGYLARYMGYDITALANDVDESNVYRTQEQREKAIRETIENLPQYYALGGTKAGVNMLLATFGILADVLVKWTNTSNPYGELLSEEEMHDRVDYEIETKTMNGSWVPTPHIDLSIPLNSNFKNFIMGDDDISRLKEQIRVFKPINVVFDDVIMTVKCAFNLVAGIACSAVELSSSSAPLLTDDDESESTYSEPELQYDDCDTLNCVF